MNKNDKICPLDGLIAKVLDGSLPTYALLYRPERDLEIVEVISGPMSSIASLEEISTIANVRSAPQYGHELLAIIPYRQISERGFECVDDREPLSVMTIVDTDHIAIDTLVRAISNVPIELEGGHYDRDDEEYTKTALQIIENEIGAGAGSNFVFKRTYIVSIANYSREKALSLFRRLLLQSTGAYWVFLIDTGDRVFIGATPERHLSLEHGTATMNPISGTYRYPASGPTVEGILEFLSDQKESAELFMVVDEELKMMSRVCGKGATLRGPYLKPMANLAHTEYLISGWTALAPWKILRETLFAPTIIGSPLENACRVVKKYEPEGRGYYSGVIALFGSDDHGHEIMDSSILIRTADINKHGTLRISTGSTLVRDSDPSSEAAETRSKAAGLLKALGAFDNQPTAIKNSSDKASVQALSAHPRVISALHSRNQHISRYWQTKPEDRYQPHPKLEGRKALVLDAEDTFTLMICHQLESFGLEVNIVNAASNFALENYDLVVLGPGPGDPNDDKDERVAHLSAAVLQLIEHNKPFLAICLSHQILCRRLGFEVSQKERPNQGTQKRIELFGEQTNVGFYNTFSAKYPLLTKAPSLGPQMYVNHDIETGDIHAIHGPSYISFQFHPESILSQYGDRLLRDAAASLLAR